jgi:hypothetical protein
MSRFSLYSLILVGLAAAVVAVGSDHPRFATTDPEVSADDAAFDGPVCPPSNRFAGRRLPDKPLDPSAETTDIAVTKVVLD